MGEPLARGLIHRRAIGDLPAIVEYNEDVTATEAAKADGGALGMRLVTIGELAAHFDIILGRTPDESSFRINRSADRDRTS